MAKAKKKGFELGTAKHAKDDMVKCYGQFFRVLSVTKCAMSWRYELKNLVSKDSLVTDEHNLRKAE